MIVFSKALPIKFYTAGNTYNQGIDTIAGVMDKIFNQKWEAGDVIPLQFYDTDQAQKNYKLYVYDEDGTKLDEKDFSTEYLNGYWYYSMTVTFGTDFLITDQVVNVKVVDVFAEIEGALTDTMETAAGLVVYVEDTNFITGTLSDAIETAVGEIVNGFPEYIAKGTADEDTTASDVYPVFMGTIIAGDLLLVQAINVQGSIGGISTPSGFTLLAEETFSWGTVAWFYKIAVGSESGPLTVNRGGSSNTYMMAQIYQIRHTSLVVEDSDANSDEGTTTADWDALTVAGEVRSLIAMITCFDGSVPATPPTGYTQEASDNSTLISGTTMKLFIKENTASGAAASAIGASYNGWGTMHLSTHNV